MRGGRCLTLKFRDEDHEFFFCGAGQRNFCCLLDPRTSLQTVIDDRDRDEFNAGKVIKPLVGGWHSSRAISNPNAAYLIVCLLTSVKALIHGE